MIIPRRPHAVKRTVLRRPVAAAQVDRFPGALVRADMNDQEADPIVDSGYGGIPLSAQPQLSGERREVPLRDGHQPTGVHPAGPGVHGHHSRPVTRTFGDHQRETALQRDDRC